MDALTVWMVRHGPTHAKCLVGWTDLDADLSDRARVARLDAYLPRGLPIISSDLRRAVQTADALDAGRQRLPHDPGLREIGFGDWEMLRHDEIPDQALARRYWEQPGDIAPPGGESWNNLSARVSATLTRLAPQGDVIVVAHFGAILCQLQAVLGLTPVEAFARRIEPLSVTRLRLGPAPRAFVVNHQP